MDSPTSAIVVDVTETFAVVRFNRPAARNPLSATTLKELGSAVSSLTSRDDLRTIIFTGSHDVFASGADIRELAQLGENDAVKFSQAGQKLFQTIADARQVTVAAIDGYCMGGGLDLALACDIRIASPQSVFAHPGARLGIITGWGGTQRLPRLIGRSAALEFFLTVRLMTSEEALKVGLITRIEAGPLDVAIKIASMTST